MTRLSGQYSRHDTDLDGMMVGGSMLGSPDTEGIDQTRTLTRQSYVVTMSRQGWTHVPSYEPLTRISPFSFKEVT